jgi:photosystem II stability/assembly factor-like uncharacterized protein
MKKVLLLLFLNSSLLTLNCFSQQYGWVALNPPSIPGTPDLSDLYFKNDSTGWISCSSTNNIFKTTDGGLTFTTQNTALTTNAIHMVSATEGYCGGASGFVFRTTDGGATWPFRGSITNTLTDISFPPDGGTGYACGLNGAVWSVTFGGVINLNSGLSLGLNGISTPSFNNVWICGGSRIYYYNGSIFTEQSSPTGTFNAIYFINNLEGWVVGDQGIIAKTINGGGSWTVQRIPGSGSSLFDVFFLNANEGWAVGANGTILHTINGGTTWTLEANGLTTAFLTGVHFTSSTNGYIVGQGKALLKYTQLTGINQTEQTSAINIYPNPTNGIIKLDIPGNQQVESVVISDMTGRKVVQKNNLFTNEIHLQSLPDGFYSVQIVTDKQQYFGKIIKQ